MHRAIKLLTAWLLLFHVVTECGSHHGHTSEQLAPVSGMCPLSMHSSQSAPCGHQHGSSQSNCQQSHCVFVGSKPRNDTVRCQAAEKCPQLEPTAIRQLAVSTNQPAHAHAGGSIPANLSSVRRHVELQVWLI